MTTQGQPYPGQYPGPYPASGPVGFVQIGDIQVRDGTVLTPAGSCPLRGSRWMMMDHSVIEQRTPVWAIVLAVVLVWFFLLSLLFLLAKEDRVSGFVEVMVSHDENRFSYRTVVPVFNRMVVPGVHSQVRQVEMMANQA
ncbi:MAG: hypothetical protein FWH11_05015 [Micrococcales bacterium]|nr:hypothetical protein [Micrococcales bacterium]